MSILDQYKAMLEAEKEQENMDFPSETNLSESDKEAYEAALKKLRRGNFSKEEVEEAINNSHKNMAALEEKHNGGVNEDVIKHKVTKLTDEELISNDLLKECSITDIKVIRAYCPKCGKELIAKSPAMYNPFTLEKMCLHECCGEKYNLNRTYPHIAFYSEDNEEIETFM